jgi:hypothetical protein
LRNLKKENLDLKGYLFPVKDALMYLQTDTKYGQGSTPYVAKNPDFGAVFTYYIKEVPQTMKEKRKEKEKELFKKGEPIPIPTETDLRKEKAEIAPYLTITITDDKDNVVRIIRKSPSKGTNRVNWDLRYQSTRFVEADKYDPLSDNGSGVLAMPGKYKVKISMTAHDTIKQIAGPVEFNAVLLNNGTFQAGDRSAMFAFHEKVAELTRVMQGTEIYTEGLLKRVNSVMQSLNSTPGASPDLQKQATDLQVQLDEILNRKLNRQSNRPSEEENPPAPVPLNTRLGKLTWITWGNTTEPTQTQKDAYKILEDEFPPVYNQVKLIGEQELPGLEKALENSGGPVTPGRLPVWKK